MKKKWIAIAGATILMMAVSACGSNENKDNQTGTSGSQNGEAITEEKAKQIALEDAGIAEEEVQNLYVHLTTDDGVQEYEVEFYAGNQEYDYDINASNGSILSKDSEAENVNAAQAPADSENAPAGQTAISEEEAKKTALAKVEGATDADIRIHLETDDGIQQYTGSIVYLEKQYDFAIDAASGAVLEWEEDSIYDD